MSILWKGAKITPEKAERIVLEKAGWDHLQSGTNPLDEDFSQAYGVPPGRGFMRYVPDLRSMDVMFEIMDVVFKDYFRYSTEFMIEPDDDTDTRVELEIGTLKNKEDGWEFHPISYGKTRPEAALMATAEYLEGK